MKTRTSKSSPLGINQVVPPSDDTDGWVAVTMAPGKKTMGANNYWDRDLDEDLDRLRALGTTTLVPLVEDDELAMLKIAGLVGAAQDRGLSVRRFAFHHGGVPRDMDETIGFIRDMIGRYARGERIVMHCNGGLGRSGAMAACLRLALGLDDSPEQAIQSVRKARGPRAVETRAQEAFVGEFYRAFCRAGAPLEADRRRGAWYGLAAGDALGAPVEFMSGQAIASRYGRWTEMRAGGPWACGEWTDDTALAIAVASAYSEPDKGYDIGTAAGSMRAWLASGPKDVGNQTRMALGMLERGIPLEDLPGAIERKNPGGAGNGSLMRAAPTGLIRKPEDPRLIEETEELSRLTHPDARCVDACVAYNVVLSTLVHEGGDVGRALAAACQALHGRGREVRELVEHVRDTDGRTPRYVDAPIGYVLLCLERALAALAQSAGFEDGLVAVVAAGGDTDTNAAVAGALLGARFGHDAIPRRWLDALQGRAELDQALGWIQGFALHGKEASP